MINLSRSYLLKIEKPNEYRNLTVDRKNNRVVIELWNGSETKYKYFQEPFAEDEAYIRSAKLLPCGKRIEIKMALIEDDHWENEFREFITSVKDSSSASCQKQTERERAILHINKK